MSDKKPYCCVNKMNMHELCAYCYNAFFSDEDFQIQMFDDYGLEPLSKQELRCECGGSAVANNTHSAWCPKFIAE